MDTRNLNPIKETIIPVLKNHGVTRVSLFDLIRLKRELEEALGTEVDLVTYDSLRPLFATRFWKKNRIFYKCQFEEAKNEKE